MEAKIGDKGMVMVRSMVLEIRENKEGPVKYLVLKAKPITQPMEPGEAGKYTSFRGIGGGQEGNDGNGDDKSIKAPRMILKIWTRRRVIQKTLLN